MGDVAYWDGLISEFKTALAKKMVDAFFISSVENRNNMRTTYTNLGNNADKFLTWLYAMRDNAAYNPHGVGVMRNLTFGVTRNGQL